MMDWTDRHCRYFHRLLSRHALLYTEMVTAPAVIHGDRVRLLGFSAEEHPVALQLGGSDPALLAEAVRIACGFGYDEINLNVGCPSDRVQNGSFGACLMREPQLVARCVEAMAGASCAEGGPEITVKCRIGVDDQVPAVALRDFIATVAAAGVSRFAVHARMAWLQGLSPKENRTIPPLDYDLVRQVRAENPSLHISLNGGIDTVEAAVGHLDDGFDGVMIGRAAYHDPLRMLGQVDEWVFGEPARAIDKRAVVEAMVEYAARSDAPVKAIGRHMLGMFGGQPGAKIWRRTLSETMHLPEAGPHTLLEAFEAMSRRPAHV
jgi:tRNA-dihydrouridine synthase A